MTVARRRLGRTAVEVSEIGLGGWAIGGCNPGWAYGATDDRTSRRAIAEAMDLGCSLFDVADSYGHGRSETLLGEVLRGRRAEVVLATKVGFDFYHGAPHPNFHPAYLRFALHQSLRRLRTECIDLYQLHNPTPEAIVDPAVIDTLEGLRTAGKIRWLGVSAGTVGDGIAAIQAGWVDVVQVTYNILAREAEDELFGLAMEYGVGILAREPLGNGMLTGKYDAESLFPPGDVRSLWDRATVAEIVRQVECVRPFCREGESMVDLALRFVLEAKAVSSVLVGAKTPEQVRQNFGVAGRAGQRQVRHLPIA